MRKEVVLAIIIGVILGGIILYGINLANNSSSQNNKTKTELETKITDTPSPPEPKNQISIITPLNNSVVTDTQVTLKGVAKANSTIAIISENDDIITNADSKGNFSSTINLSSGENLITVTGVDDNQATASSTINVIRTETLP